MNVELFNRDLAMLVAMTGKQIGQVDWSTEKRNDMWLIIWDAIRIPTRDQGGREAGTNQFNREDIDLKLPLPQNLYDPVPGQRGHVYFYRDIFLSPELLVWDRAARRWRQPRHYFTDANPHTGKALGGWAYLCLLPRCVDRGKNVLSVLAQVQRFLLHEA